MAHKFTDLEQKFMTQQPAELNQDGAVISGYASRFDILDQARDVVKKGAFAKGLRSHQARNIQIKMLWQHDPRMPIGVWDEVYEDERGLFVKGRILTDIQSGREAMALLSAGAVDGLSIGYRVKKKQKLENEVRALIEVELWEVSLVTFPMLIEARVETAERKDHESAPLSEIADLVREIHNLNRLI